MLKAMKIPRPTRRWFQFSLRALLVFVTLFAFACSLLAVKIRQAKREEAAVAAIIKSGAQRIKWSGRASGPTWLRSVLGEHFFSHVIIVDFGIVEVLNGVTPSDLNNALKQWQDSNRSNADAMRRLLLEGHPFTDSALEPLDAMNQLQELYLGGGVVTDAGLGHLRRMPGLKKLDLSCTEITDAGLEELAALRELDELDIAGTKVTDAGLEKLAGLDKLERLNLSLTGVTDIGLEHLRRMKRLRSVALLGTEVTVAGVKKLQQALPNCRIDFNPLW